MFVSDTKVCSKCSNTKDKSEFFKRTRSVDGYESECKICRKKRNAKWFSENRKRHNIMMKDWYQKNRDKHLQDSKDRYCADKAYALSKYYKRSIRTKIATPSWADQKTIAEFYRIAKHLEKTIGGKWEVDHIVPIQSNLVCGLHVQTNLQVIPAEQNRQKSNSYWPDMPEGELE